MADMVETLPSDCGLALSLPMSLADVETALQGGPYNDYVKRAGEASAAANREGVFSRVAARASADPEPGLITPMAATDAGSE